MPRNRPAACFLGDQMESVASTIACNYFHYVNKLFIIITYCVKRKQAKMTSHYIKEKQKKYNIFY